jgi:dCTP deaminase
MILGGVDIIKERNVNNLTIEPFDQSQVGPNSYDVRLDNVLLKLECNAWKDGIEYIDPRLEQKVHKVMIPENGFLILPGELWLGSTIERAGSSKYVPMYDGRSTIGRMGVWSHVSAGFGDVGFDSTWTLEITCIQPFLLLPGMKIGQVFFHDVSDASMNYSKGHSYHGQNGPVVAKAGNI